MTTGSTESKSARFGCGFVLGVVFAGVSGVGAAYANGRTFLAVTLVVAVIFGLAAMQFGDEFWRRIGKWLK